MVCFPGRCTKEYSIAAVYNGQHSRDDDLARTVQSVVEEVKELAKARRDQCVPTPMDVSAVAGGEAAQSIEEQRGDEEYWPQQDDWQDVEVQACTKGRAKVRRAKERQRPASTAVAPDTLRGNAPRARERGNPILDCQVQIHGVHFAAVEKGDTLLPLLREPVSGVAAWTT